MKIKVNFRQIEHLLFNLGFEMKMKKGSHVFFIHPESHVIIALHVRRKKESLPIWSLVSVRKSLIENGFVNDVEEFNELLTKKRKKWKK